ncbi:MAG: TldD/PmbA family protein [Nanoarchaeota archaeon]|nr:TldD/PmbA family protein [Nanoarchaeota archaeon]
MNSENLLKEFEAKAELVEYFKSNIITETLLQNNNELKTFVNSKAEAYSVRMLVNGAWGFASTSNEEEVPNVFNTCFRLALNASKLRKNKTVMKELEVNKDVVKAKVKLDPFSISGEDKKDFIKEFNKSFNNGLIKNADTTLSFNKLNTQYVNSMGADVSEERIYSQILSSIIGGERLANAVIIRRAQQGYDFIKKTNINSEIMKAESRLKRLIKAVNVKPGIYNIVVDPSLAGTFFHEAVGHALEADHLREKNTCLALGEKFNKNLTLYDDPTLPKYWGSYAYDSEGIRAKPSILIDKGRIVNFMNDVASYFDIKGLKKTANGRSQNPHSVPITRMSNTVVKPGDYSKEELFEKVKNGLFVCGFSGGAVEPVSGIFSFQAEEAFEIRNGKKKGFYRGVTLSGDLKRLLNDITGIGKIVKNEWSGGSCGKREQWVPVSEKMPHISVRGVSVGN